MTSSKLTENPVASSAGSRSPERQALAAAIERHNAAKQRLEAIERARREITQKIVEARRVLDQATSAIETAQSNCAQHLTNAALGYVEPAPQSMKQARAALQDAQDELDALHAARSKLESDIPAAQTAKWTSELGLETRIRDVVKSDPAIESFVERYREERRIHGRMPQGPKHELLEFFDRKRMLPHRFSLQKIDAEACDNEMQVWQDAIKALEEDPDAPLPDR